MATALIRKLRLPVILIINLFIGYHLSTASSFAPSDKYIRVAIIQDAASLSLKVSGSCRILDPGTGRVLWRAGSMWTTVAPYSEGILVAGKGFKARKIMVKADDAGLIVINGRRFRGAIELIKKDDGRLFAINHIELEDYIRGILYHESSHYWPEEALKAQAIVCRTYAAYQMQENRAKDFDVTSDIYSQVYGGETSERYRTNAAVDATRGKVLTYKGKTFPAYFHATCAGHTEDAALLWNINIPPLKGVACRFCKNSPHFSWHAVLAQKKVKEALLKAGYNLGGDIREIKVLGKDASGRIAKLRIVSRTKDTDIEAKDLRNVIGPNLIRSTNFTIQVTGSDLVLEGLGWGHGVGLCQWGGYFMAKEGYNYKKILEYYYPESRVETL